MPNETQDIRVTKTQRALFTALLELLEKKSFQKITVNDICQNAMVSRSTFYLHFEDKYRLLLFCLQTEREKLQELAPDTDPRAFIRSVLQTVRNRENTYRNLFLADIDVELVDMFHSLFYKLFCDMLEKYRQQGAKLAGAIPLIAVYYAHGLSGMIIWWIKNRYPVSVEELAQCQYNLLAEILPN